MLDASGDPMDEAMAQVLTNASAFVRSLLADQSHN